MRDPLDPERDTAIHSLAIASNHGPPTSITCASFSGMWRTPRSKSDVRWWGMLSTLMSSLYALDSQLHAHFDVFSLPKESLLIFLLRYYQFGADDRQLTNRGSPTPVPPRSLDTSPASHLTPDEPAWLPSMSEFVASLPERHTPGVNLWDGKPLKRLKGVL